MIKNSIASKLENLLKGHYNCIISLCLPLHNKQHVDLFSVYAPTLHADTVEKGKFFTDLHCLTQKVPADDKIIILHDFNARGGVVDGITSIWQLVNSAVLQDSILSPVLFKNFVNNLDNGHALNPGGLCSALDGRFEIDDRLRMCIQTEDEEILKSMKSCVNETLTTIAQYFGQLIELVLTHEAQNLLRQIELSDSVYVTESAISSLFSLTQEGAHLCQIIAKDMPAGNRAPYVPFAGGFSSSIKKLISVIPEDNMMKAARQTYQLTPIWKSVDGILCLADILTDNSHSEATHAEAAAVIAQITSPHLTFTQHLSSFLENMEEIVTALVKLCQEASSGEVFLLASAALANITFFDTMACEILLQLNAMKILLAACSDKRLVDTPYSRDQISQQYEVRYKLLQALIDIVTGVCGLLVFGIFDLEESQPAFLVILSCQAALRRLAVMNPDGLEDSDFQQLVKPRLVDSFLLCTNMEESFV
ncbi:Protein inscuteable like protein [Willisornis vidua]|uniref:Protein inscuteable like protein n=1 Tax=Willisornis vidua TaxID=1566151 RepID=A0ABQ9CXK1_9PASS|nr:Protein inscuteable like protein [Willisornis vidua]